MEPVTTLTRSELLALLYVLDEVRGGAQTPWVVNLIQKLEKMRDEILKQEVLESTPAAKCLLVIGLQNCEEDLPRIQSEAHAHFDQVEYIQLPMEYGTLKQCVQKHTRPGEQAYLLIDWIGLRDQGLHVADLGVEAFVASASEFGSLRAAQFPEAALNVAFFLCEQTGKIPVLISALRDGSHERYFNVWFPSPFRETGVS